MQEEFLQSVLGPILFDIFINDLDKEMEWALIKLADDSTPWGAIDTLESTAAIQKDWLPASGKTKDTGKKESYQIQEDQKQNPVPNTD